MSKVRCFTGRGYYKYFEHCPFCGSVKVDFDHESFHCPDCGAVVTFDLPEMDYPICDGETDSEKLISRWNRRVGEEITADDLCVMAQKTEREDLVNYQDYIAGQVWGYIVKSAMIGKFSCEVPAKYVKNAEKLRKKKLDVEKKGDIYIVSWRKDIEWD